MKMARYIAMAAMILSPLVVHAADPFLGKWSLDVKRSKYAMGGCPKRMTIEMSAAENGVHYHSETVLTNGNVVIADYTANYDGKPVVVLGTRGVLLPVSLKKLRPTIVVAEYVNGLQTVATSRRTVTADGSTMTITTTSPDKAGKSAANVGVYRRTAPAASRHSNPTDIGRGLLTAE